MRTQKSEARFSNIVRLLAGFAIVPVFLMAIFSLTASPLKAQTFYGTITGTVMDASGGVIPNATVTAINIGTNEARTMKTNAAGEYRFVNLVPTTYRVEVVATNFKKFVQASVPVLVDSSIRVDAKLEVGAASETIEVTELPPMLQTESGSVGAQVESKTVQGMPLNGRNSMNLLTLVPGIIAGANSQGPVGGNSGNSHTQINGFGNYAIAGGIGNESGNYVDGAPANMLGTNVVGLILSQDVVQEFKVSMNAVSADFGRFGGGVVEMTSKSGTNQFHGSGYEYVRNTMLNTLPFYSKWNLASGATPAAPPYHQNQYGGTIGGPIIRNKVFGFFGIENYVQHVSASGNGVVPTAIMRGQSTNYPNMAIFNHQIVDNSTKGCAIVTNPMGAGTNTWGVPSSCWDASAQVMKQFYPLPNNPAFSQDDLVPNKSGQNDWLALAHVGNTTLNYSARGDANVSSKQRIFGRYSVWSIQDIPTDNYATASPALPFNHTFGQTRFFNHGITVGDTYTVNQNTVADLRLSWDRMTQFNFPVPEHNKMDESKFGPAYATIANTETFHNQPTVTFGAGNNYGYQIEVPLQAAQTDIYENYTLNASVVKIIGRHTVKVGGETTLRNHSGIGNFAYYGGYFVFSPHESAAPNGSGGLVSATGDEYASFMLGDYDSLIWQTQANSFAINWSHALFVTDTWRLSQNLTVNVGARWEYPGGIYEKKDRDAIFLPNATDPNQNASSPGGAPNPQHLPGTLALVNTAASPGRGISPSHKALFGPRVSFAERLKWNSVIRGGYGISYLPPDMPVGLMAFNSPVNGYQTNNVVGYTGSSMAAPGYFLSNPLPATAPTGYLNAYPNGLSQPPGRTDPNPTHLYLGNSIAVPMMDKRYPYMQQWNLAFSKQWKGDLLTEVAYMGSKGTHLPDAGVTVSGQNGLSGLGIDQLDPKYYYLGTSVLGSSKAADYTTAFGSGVTACPRYNGTNTLKGTALSIPVYQCLEQFPQFSNVININSNGGSTHYSAVYISVQKRFRAGGVINGSFTRSKAIGDTDQPGNGNNFQNFYDRASEKSVSSFDIPNRMVVSYVIDLPFGKNQKWLNSGGALNYIAGGWQVNGIAQMQSGAPFAFTYTNPGFLFSQGKGNAGTSRPDLLPGCDLKGSGGNVYQKLIGQTSGKSWFNTTCVVAPGVTQPNVVTTNGSGQLVVSTAAGQSPNLLAFGSAPRSINYVRGPINQNWDLALSKTTPIWEHVNLLLRAEVFDLWNHPTVGNATGGYNSGAGNGLGYVNPNNIANAGTGGMRLIQLSGRINF